MIDGDATDLLGMSDEDFLNLNSPPSGEKEEEVPVSGSQEAETAPTPTPEAVSEAGTAAEASEAAPTAAGEGEAPAAEGSATEPTLTPEQKPEGEKPAGEPEVPTEKPTEKQAEEAPDYKSFYEQVMKPFKANGKMIELRSPDEAVALMQMGANYTRKMQELQPHRKTLLMLQNNNLLDPDKLSFLIDLDRGDPEAVKKFIKDRGIDPLDIDTSTDPAYLGGNHQVSDEEAAFRTVVEDLSTSETGTQTLRTVNDTWDTASKEVLWKNPEVLSVIHEQMENGVYTAISAEIDRRRVLGTLKADVPFIEAYRVVGEELSAAAAKTDPVATPSNAAEVQPAAPQPLATRAAAPKSPVTNADQVAAVSPSRGTATKQKVFRNPLEMPDEEFLKLMENRV